MMRSVIYIILLFTLILIGCQREYYVGPQEVLPSDVSMEVPQSINASDEFKLWADTVNPKMVYNFARYYVNAGLRAFRFLQDVLVFLRKYDIQPNQSFAYEGRDGHVKYVTVKSDCFYDRQSWQFCMTIYEGQDSQQLAMMMFWNRDPVQILALIRPSALNTLLMPTWRKGMVRIYFSQNPTDNKVYRKTLTVEVSNKPTNGERFAPRNMKIFFGRKEDIVNIVGNIELPNAWLLVRRNMGLEWALVASANIEEDIAVAQIGLPPNFLNNNKRTVLLDTYSIYNVLRQEFIQWYQLQYGSFPDTDLIENYLRDARTPGYYNTKGFIQSGISPDRAYKPLEEEIAALTPYNPYVIANLEIDF